MISIGSLFTGIGGLDLGLEWAGLGPVRWQVEIDPFRRRVLEARWPGVTRYEDVCDVDPTQLAPVDLVCGGFPCQDISPAGTGEGLAGSRSGLWRQFRRIVSAIRPRPPWVLVENSGGAASRWVETVARELGFDGYECLPLPVSAWGCGASHERARVFLLAYLDEERLRQQQQRLSGGRATGVRDEGQAEPAHDGAAPAPGHRGGGARPGGAHLRADAAQERRDARVLEKGDGATCHASQRAKDGRAFSWGFEPDLVRAVHGLPHRVDRVAALGDSVVPHCAEVVGHVILQLQGQA